MGGKVTTEQLMPKSFSFDLFENLINHSSPSLSKQMVKGSESKEALNGLGFG